MRVFDIFCFGGITGCEKGKHVSLHIELKRTYPAAGCAKNRRAFSKNDIQVMHGRVVGVEAWCTGNGVRDAGAAIRLERCPRSSSGNHILVNIMHGLDACVAGHHCLPCSNRSCVPCVVQS